MIGDKWGFHILYFTAAKHVTISFQLILLIYFYFKVCSQLICLNCLNCENKHGSFHRLALLYIVDLFCTSTCRFMMSWFFSCCWHVDGTWADMNLNETVNVLGTQHPLARSHSWMPCRTAEWSGFFWATWDFDGIFNAGLQAQEDKTKTSLRLKSQGPNLRLITCRSHLSWDFEVTCHQLQRSEVAFHPSQGSEVIAMGSK